MSSLKKFLTDVNADASQINPKTFLSLTIAKF